MRRSPTTPSQSSHSTLISDPLLTWFVLAPKSLQGGTLETGAAYRLYSRSTSAKNPHHSRQLSLTFDLSCMGTHRQKSSQTSKSSPARFTSRPEARGSGVEAVFRFLGSGVDSRGKKGRKGSEGRELGSGVRLQCKTSPM